MMARKVAFLGALGIALACVACGSSTTKTIIIRTVNGSPATTTVGSGTTAAPPPSGPTRVYSIPSPAMLPTLKIGEHIVVSLASNYTPQVGDIIVFHPPVGADPTNATCGNPNQGAGHSQACDQPTPQESNQTFVKRVVAGPGDVIRMIDGHVYRNGVRENDSYTYACGGGSICTFPTPITIPSGDYFVLGDNRGESDDSRFWGPVPRAWIIGKVIQP